MQTMSLVTVSEGCLGSLTSGVLWDAVAVFPTNDGYSPPLLNHQAMRET